MKEERHVSPVLIKVALWLFIIATSIVILKYFEVILKPVIIAFFFWFLINELNYRLSVIKIVGRQIPYLARGIIATAVITLIIMGVSEIISANILHIIDKMPEYSEKSELIVAEITKIIDSPKFTDGVRHAVQEINILEQARTLLQFVSGLLTNSFIVFVYVIFMMLEESHVKTKMSKIFPVANRKRDNVFLIIRKINKSIKTYLVSKTLISVITGVLCYFVLLFLKVDFAVLWAFLIFMFNYVPYLGSVVATLLPTVFALFQYGSIVHMLYVLACVQTIQFIMGNIVETRMMGKSLNLSPLTVMLSLVVWGAIWGVVGMILSVPLTAFLVIVMSNFESTRVIAIFLSETGDLYDEE